MKKYEFVKLELKGAFPPKKTQEDYHKIIIEYAEKGWSLVQIFAPVTAAGPFAEFFELIFEKEV